MARRAKPYTDGMGDWRIGNDYQAMPRRAHDLQYEGSRSALVDRDLAELLLSGRTMVGVRPDSSEPRRLGAW